MGTESVVLGYIAEPWIANDDRNEHFRDWNRRILAELPQQDAWPPLSRELFAWTALDPLRGGYRGSVIHFAGRFKSIEQEWGEWLSKYEQLLGRLFWESSVVYLHTELAGDFKFEWCLSSWASLLSSPPVLATSWEFQGPFRVWPPTDHSWQE